MGDFITIYTDGASRGNPGPAAAAYILYDRTGSRISAKAQYLEKATNNIAEYTALINALEDAKNRRAAGVKIFSDSELMVRQLKGEYKVKNEGIAPLFQKCNELLNGFAQRQIEHIGREKNAAADKLANRAIDARGDIEEVCETPGRKIRLGVLISGGGRTLLNINDLIKAGKLNAEIAVVISSLSQAPGVQRAQQAGLNVKIIRRKDYNDIAGFSEALKKTLLGAKVELVIQAGWLCLWTIPAELHNRVMNIHPALLPAFGGQGMWGHYVHQAVLKRGCKISGCTVHFCTNEYDAGPIIIQRTCPVLDTDTPDSLAARVFEQECIAYPQAIKLFAQDRLIVENGIVRIKQ